MVGYAEGVSVPEVRNSKRAYPIVTLLSAANNSKRKKIKKLHHFKKKLYLCFAIIMDYYDIAKEGDKRKNCSPERVQLLYYELNTKF